MTLLRTSIRFDEERGAGSVDRWGRRAQTGQRQDVDAPEVLYEGM